jgi:hypothetical protein
VEVDPAKSFGGLLGAEGNGKQGREQNTKERRRDKPHGLDIAEWGWKATFLGIFRALEVYFYAHLYLSNSGTTWMAVFWERAGEKHTSRVKTPLLESRCIARDQSRAYRSCL